MIPTGVISPSPPHPAFHILPHPIPSQSRIPHPHPTRIRTRTSNPAGRAPGSHPLPSGSPLRSSPPRSAPPRPAPLRSAPPTHTAAAHFGTKRTASARGPTPSVDARRAGSDRRMARSLARSLLARWGAAGLVGWLVGVGYYCTVRWLGWGWSSVWWGGSGWVGG
jgi:hypothetical protein